MELLYLIEKIRTPFLDWFFSLITHLGEETVFLVLAIFFFWCVSKREGYYILTVGLVGTVVNQLLKLAFRIPRPWVKDPSFTIVESARAEATGYSFPSGHTQNVAGTLGGVGRYSKSLPVRIISIALIVLVAFSRMYLGVHTPLDVGVSLIVAAVLVFGLYPMFKTEERFEKFMPYVVLGSLLLSIAFLMYFPLFSDGAHEAENLASGMKNAFTLAGCTAGLAIVYALDSKYIKFDTKAPWYAQIIKLVVGLGVIIGIKVGLSSPLVSLFGNEYIARMVRYLLIVLFAGAVWPLTFKYFAKMRIKPLDTFGAWVASIFKKRDTDTAQAENK
ncbi:MAG: phosphatase PAP2 family protein [Clostridia bacterium]|nr:phosphatase PAP2 family protein [Clostridia bacterium]